MGNICRSPVAEGVFLHLAREAGLHDRFVVDSAGTGGWHAGSRPDRRAIEVASARGIDLPSIARQVTRDDFARFDHLVVMDTQNEEDLLELGAPREKVVRLLEFRSKGRLTEVPDPYYGGMDGFELMYELIDDGCRGLLARLALP